MSGRRVHKICICAVVVGVFTMMGSAPALGSLLATATISSVPDPDLSDFDYTIILTNTGDTNIGTFWFAWTPPEITEYDFLPSLPSSTSQPNGWIGAPSNGFPANSVEYYNDTGSLITPGHTGTFGFVSSDDPNTIKNGVVFGFPMATSFIYAGAPEVGAFTRVDPVFVAAPEPSSLLLLAGLGCTATWCRRRRPASV
jgi:hypothetical protein